MPPAIGACRKKEIPDFLPSHGFSRVISPFPDSFQPGAVEKSLGAHRCGGGAARALACPRDTDSSCSGSVARARPVICNLKLMRPAQPVTASGNFSVRDGAGRAQDFFPVERVGESEGGGQEMEAVSFLHWIAGKVENSLGQ